MSYNRDLQEDKERLFDTVETVRATVRIGATMLRHSSVNREACFAAASDPALLATDLADYLVRKGIPFRKAHHAVGALVALAERERKLLDQLTLEQMRSVEKSFANDALKIFDLEQALARRKVIGSPGTNEVKKQLSKWQKLLDLSL